MGWLVGDSGKIVKTTDGGNSWHNLSSGVSAALLTAQFLDEQTGWVGGAMGTLLKTTDGGENWVAQPSGVHTAITRINIIDAQSVWAAGENGVVLRSTNGGTTWSLKHHIDDADVMGSYFADTLTGWITTLGSVLKKTTNGGISWDLQDSTPAGWFTSIAFSDSLHGLYVGYQGGTTSDGGVSWTPLSLEYDLFDICFADARHGWMVGFNGTILHTSTGGITPVHKTIVSSPTFTLYPNPAQEWVSLHTNSPIREVQVTDAMGRSIAETGNALFLPEIHTGNRLNISTWRPGLYQVKIQTAEGTAVQRVVKR